MSGARLRPLATSGPIASELPLSVSGCFSGDAYSVHRYVMFTRRIKRIFS